MQPDLFKHACGPSSLKETRGSILMITAILATIMAVAIGGFIKLGSHESRLADLSFHMNGSLNLAEGGVERALYALNHDDWQGWTRANGLAVMQPVTRDLGANRTGEVNVRIEDYAGRPVVLAEGKILLPNRPSVTRQIRVELSRRSPFANGITSREGATFKGGNVTVDSYRSSLGPPSASNRFDNGSVASVSVETDAVDLSNSEIYGYVATGGSMPTVGPKGRIYGKDSPSGVKVDMNRVALDFTSDFPEVGTPSYYHHYIHRIHETRTLGTPGATHPTVYLVGNISLSGGTSLTIVGPVVIRVLESVDVTGKASIVVSETGKAVFYADHYLGIGGNGAINATTIPANLLIYGTNRVRQTIKLAGNGQLRAAVYAPNGDIEIKGNGSVSGAIVGRTVVLNDNADFHYDEDLGDLRIDRSYRLDHWSELHAAADRIAF